MTTAAIYTRISSDPDHKELGVKRQEADCRALCLERGWDVAEVYQDNDLSAYKSTVVRPGFQAMLKAAEAGTVGAIVVYDADRMTRQPIEWEHIIGLVDRKGTALASCTGPLDLATDQGQFMARIMGAVARKSSDDTKRRIKRKLAELASAGKYSGGGLRAFGYASDRKTVVPAEAAIIREMVSRVLAGDTIKGIAADLDRRGVSTVSGRFGWRTSTIKQLITSGRIAGRREANGADIAAAEWPAIVELRDVERIRGLLESRDPKARTVRKYALTGLIFCGTCGGPLRGAGLHHGHRRYGCVKDAGTSGRCAAIFIRADEIEDYARTRAVGHMLQVTDYGTRGAAVANSAEVETRLRVNQHRLGQLFKAADDVPDFDTRLADLRHEIDADKALLAQQSPENVALDDLAPRGKDGRPLAFPDSPRAWELLEPARQSAILKLVYRRIEIGPGRHGRQPKGRLAERVSIVYADGGTSRIIPKAELGPLWTRPVPH